MECQRHREALAQLLDTTPGTQGGLWMSQDESPKPAPRIVLLRLPSKLDLCPKGEAKSLPDLAQQGFPLDSHLFILSPNPLFQKPKCRQQPGENHTSLEHLLPAAGQNLPETWLRLPLKAMSGHGVTEAKIGILGEEGMEKAGMSPG